jgi:hypothetical protein
MNPEKLFLCITHCDKEMPTDAFVYRKLETYKKYCKMTINQSNVIKFNYTKESLIPFTQ